jgi:hypothetical protein
MPLRCGKEYRKKEYRKKEYQKKTYLKNIFPKETMPFNMVLLPERGKKYKIDIDFDESSKAWRKNKIKLSEGMFKYKVYRKIIN